MSQIKAIILFIFCLGITFSSFAQDYFANIKYLNTSDGLSHRDVYCIHQDQYGLMWIGTKDGLNRYDGYEFTWWTKEKNGLSSNKITNLLEDKRGFLWAFSMSRGNRIDALSLIHIPSGNVVPLEERFGETLPFQISDLENYFQDENRLLYFVTKDHELWSFDGGEKFKQIKTPNNFDALNYTANPPSIWGISGENLLQLNPKGDILQSYVYKYKPKKIIRDGRGRYWAKRSLQSGKNLDLISSNVVDSDTLNTKLTNYLGRSIEYSSSNQTMWFGERQSFIITDLEFNTIYSINTQKNNIFKRDIRTLYFDNQGLAWVGTQNGLYLIQLKKNLFARYLYSDLEEKKQEKKHFLECRGILEHDSTLFVNTYDGRRKIDFRTKEISITLRKPNTYKQFPLHKDANNQLWTAGWRLILMDLKTGKEKQVWESNSQIHPKCWAIHKDRRGRVWMGVIGGLRYIEEGRHKTIQDFNHYNGFEDLRESLVLDLHEDKEGKLWIASNKGLYVFEYGKGITAKYGSSQKNEYYLPSKKIQHIYEDKNNIFWLATANNGLIRWNPKIKVSEEKRNATKKSKHPEKSPPLIPHPLPNNNSTVMDRNLSGHHIWRSRFTKDTIEQRIKVFSRLYGFASNNIYAVYEDDFNHLWMSSGHGIICLNKSNYDIRNYNVEDGITHYEFNRISHYQAKDGRLYFGGLNGVTAFYPKELHKDTLNREDIEVIMVNLDVFFARNIRNMPLNLLEKHKSLVLGSEDRFFIVSVASKDYFNTSKIRYSYKIDGFQEEWIYFPSNRIRFTRWQPGNYKLRIRAQGGDGRFSKKELVIPIRNTVPWNHKPKYLIFISLLVMGGVIWYFRWRNKQIRERRLELEKQVAERTQQIEEDTKIIEQQANELRKLDETKSRFFANVSHELRTPLTLILGPIQSMLNRNKIDNRDYTYLKIMKQNGEDLLKKINEILDLSKLESSKMELNEKPIQFYVYLRRIVSVFESHAQHNSIQLSFNYQAEQNLLLLLDTDKFETILNNLLSNALKFTSGNGLVKVLVEDLGQNIELSVSDTGQGIHPNDLPHIFDRFYQSKQQKEALGGTGIGLALCQELVRLMKGTIGVESTYGEGSKFVVCFPKIEVLGSIKEELEVEEEAPIPIMETPKKAIHAKTILLVEDNASLRQYIQFILEMYTVVTARNGKEALDLLQPSEKSKEIKALLPNLIISDVMMPEMDGFTLLKKLKEDKNLQQISVIMLTARADIKDKLMALRIGVDDYMLKPFNNDELLAKVANLLLHAEQRTIYKSSEPETKVPDSLLKDSIELSLNNQKWLKELEVIIKKELTNRQFNLSFLEQKLTISKRQLQRKIKQCTGLTPIQYIREIRLHQAQGMLESGDYSTVSEVSYGVGFEDQHYFSTLYKKRFGKKPSTYFGKRK